MKKLLLACQDLNPWPHSSIIQFVEWMFDICRGTFFEKIDQCSSSKNADWSSTTHCSFINCKKSIISIFSGFEPLAFSYLAIQESHRNLA